MVSVLYKQYVQKLLEIAQQFDLLYFTESKISKKRNKNALVKQVKIFYIGYREKDAAPGRTCAAARLERTG